MNCNFYENEKMLLLEITEDIDHHGTEKIKKIADNEITRFMPKKVVLDFSNVSFMDSSGIGMLIGRYKMSKLVRQSNGNYQYKEKYEKDISYEWY